MPRDRPITCGAKRLAGIHFDRHARFGPIYRTVNLDRLVRRGCPTCGRRASASATWCRYCGRGLSRANAAQILLILIGTAIFLGLLLAAGWSLLH